MLVERILFISTFLFIGLDGILGKNLNQANCPYSCESGFPHTLCMPEGSGDCEGLKLTPTSDLKDDVLIWHNLVRNELAGGKRAGFVPNMRKMYWDDELERMARTWASKCEPANDRCRKLPRFEVGQNVGLFVSRRHKDSLNIFIEWVNPGLISEDYFLQPGLVRSNPNTNRYVLKRFFQVVWPETYLIGCAEATYNRNGFEYRLLVCNYGPSAFERKILEPIFSANPPCSRCPVKTQCPGKQGNQSHPLSNLCAVPSLEDDTVEIERIESARRISSEFEAELKVGKARRYLHKRRYRFGSRQLNSSEEEGDGDVVSPGGETSSEGFDYCSLQCGSAHVMCQRQPKRNGCRKSKIVVGSELEKYVLGKFNEIRNDVAGGKVPHLPAASNMRLLEWDEELADLATTWATSCPIQRDACRDTEHYHVYQIVSVSVSSAHTNRSMAAKSVENFMNTAPTFPLKDICGYGISDQDPHPSPYSYLSQILWAKSHKVGCAEVLYSMKNDAPSCEGGPSNQYSSLVCNFADGGNVKGKNIYKLGEPCMSCPVGTWCSEKNAYPNLCVRSNA